MVWWVRRVLAWSVGQRMPREADVNAQSQQPQMQSGRKRGGRGVIVKDRAVIQGDAPRQTQRQEGTSQHELVRWQGGDWSSPDRDNSRL